MATKTSTSISSSITQKGDLFVVKEVKTKTTTSPGKEPIVEVTESVNEYKGRENLPEAIRRQLDNKQTNQPINMEATRGNFAQDALNEINKYRKMHGADPLALSSQLVEHCKKRAQKMADANDMLDSEDAYGESVTCMSSNDPQYYVKADAVVSRWYSGSQGYDYAAEPTELVAGHFTQMVWKNSKEFGIAAAKSKENVIYVVACFNPRGNYTNMFLQNVCPPVAKDKSIFGRCLFNIFDKRKSTREGNAGTKKEEEGGVSKLNRESVECHNKYRRIHGVPALKYSGELAAYAQEWANELARRDAFEHRKDGTFGENLYSSYSSDANAVAGAGDACDSWYSEIRDYAFGREPESMKTGHFTQMIWRDTREVGMGIARSRSGRDYIVANYNPAGNFVGRFAENVPKPLE